MGREGTALGGDPEAVGAPDPLCCRSRANKNEWERWKPGARQRAAGRATGKDLGELGEGISPLQTHQRIKRLARSVPMLHPGIPLGSNRVGVPQHPIRRRSASIKAPKSRTAASSSQGFARRPGERQPPSSERGHLKDKTPHSPRHGELPARCVPGTAVHPPVLETQRAKPWGGEVVLAR